MKRIDLIRHLERHGCGLFREGGSHSVYFNRVTRKSSAVPRHREINDFSCPQDLSGSRDSDALTSDEWLISCKRPEITYGPLLPLGGAGAGGARVCRPH